MRLCEAAVHRTALHRTAPHRTAPHRTAPHRTTPHRDLQVQIAPSRFSKVRRENRTLRIFYGAILRTPCQNRAENRSSSRCLLQCVTRPPPENRGSYLFRAVKVEPLYPGLKYSEVRREPTKESPKRNLEVSSTRNIVVTSSPAVLSHQKVDFCRLKRERFSNFLRPSLESTILR